MILLNVSHSELVTFLDLPRVKMNLEKEHEIDTSHIGISWSSMDLKYFLDVDKSFQIGTGFCNPGIMDWFFFVGGSRKYDCSVEKVFFSEAEFGSKYVRAMRDCCLLQKLIWQDYKGAMRLMMDHLQPLQETKESSDSQLEVVSLNQTVSRLRSAGDHSLTSPEMSSQSFRILSCNFVGEKTAGCNLAKHVPSNRGLAIGFNLPAAQDILTETRESQEFAEAISAKEAKNKISSFPATGSITFQFIVQRSVVSKRMDQLESRERNVEKVSDSKFLLNLHDVAFFPDLRQRFLTLEPNTIHNVKVRRGAVFKGVKEVNPFQNACLLLPVLWASKFISI